MRQNSSTSERDKESQNAYMKKLTAIKFREGLLPFEPTFWAKNKKIKRCSTIILFVVLYGCKSGL
jgi:hypothetical protein